MTMHVMRGGEPLRVQPLTVRRSPHEGGLAPLEVARKDVRTREELLLPLGPKERMLVVGIAEALKILEPEGVELREAAVPLLAAFRGATGVPYTEASW